MNKEIKFEIRDWFAAPVVRVAFFFVYLGIWIGGPWTAFTLLKIWSNRDK